MKLNTYVNFAGKCAETFHFYEEHLGGKIGMMMTNGQAPDQSRVNPEWKEAVLHARISIGDTDLMGADIPDAQSMRSAYLSLAVPDRSRDGVGTLELLFAFGREPVIPGFPVILRCPPERGDPASIR
jgi:uncharacterized glyoxalase superfamily protein PhnB